MAPMMEANPVTGVKEPYFPEKVRRSRMLTGSMVIIMMVSSIKSSNISDSDLNASQFLPQFSNQGHYKS